MVGGTLEAASLTLVVASLCADGFRSQSECHLIIYDYMIDVHGGDFLNPDHEAVVSEFSTTSTQP